MRRVIFVVIAMLVVGCGSTSGIKKDGQKAVNLDFSGYDAVLVNSFGDGTKKQTVPLYASDNFVDRLVSAIRRTGAYSTVTSNADRIEGNALVVGGNITRYAEGNPALKMLIGMGAGSTYFDADVVFADKESQSELGQITVDRNSWGLGGAVAAGQTVEQFMNEAAQKIASELDKAKRYQAPADELAEAAEQAEAVSE